jgi:hypothetical protein
MIIYILEKKSYIKLVLISIASAYAIYLSIKFGHETIRSLRIPFLVYQIKQHGAFLIWNSFLSYETNIVQFLFGHGIGIVSRGAQILGNYSILNGSCESYVLRIYFEIGIIGLIFMLYIYLKSTVNLLKIPKYRYLGLILVAQITNIATTPSFYSFVISFFYYGIIMFGFMTDGKKNKANL